MFPLLQLFLNSSASLPPSFVFFIPLKQKMKIKTNKKTSKEKPKATSNLRVHFVLAT